MTRTAPPGGRRAGDPQDALVRELHATLTSLVQRAPLFADLRRQGIAEDLVQDTLIAVTQRMSDGHVIDDPAAYAARCVTNLAKRTYLRGAREQATTDETLELLGPRVQDVADRVDQRMTMAEVLDMVRSVNGVIAALEPLELEVVKAELARTDQKRLAATLGISRPTLYRRKGPAIAAFVVAVAQRAGTTPCTEHLGALLAAAGDSGFGAARAATAHAQTCEQCRETIRHLRVARHGLAVIAPVPLMGQTDPTAAFDRALAAFHTTGDWLRAIVLRTGDPLPLGGSATKTVALVAAACTGGGGVYCAVDGVPSQLKAPFAQAAEPHGPQRSSVLHGQHPRASASTIAPAAQVIAGVATSVQVAAHHDAHVLAQQRATRRVQARARAAVRAAALARREREQAAAEFAARASPTTSGDSREFASPAPSTPGEFAPAAATPTTTSSPASATQTRREFAAPAGSSPAPSATSSEFGAP